MKKRLQCEHIAYILGLLKNNSEKITKSFEDVGIKIPNIFKEIIEPLENQGISSIFLILGKIFKDNVGEGSKQIEKNLNIIDLINISPCYYNKLCAL